MIKIKALFLCLLVFPILSNADSPAYEEAQKLITPKLPYDVDITALKNLDLPEQIPEGQRLFDRFAWQAFIALNWPVDKTGKPLKKLTDGGNSALRNWMSWRNNDTVFLVDGGTPEPWDATEALNSSKNYLWKSSKMLDESRSPVSALHETNQAFKGPLIDQNGKFVRYESYINKAQFDYIYANQLYNQEGQAEFTTGKMQSIRFPANTVGQHPKHGSMGIKLSWKELGDNDIPERYITREYYVVRAAYDKNGEIITNSKGEPKGEKTKTLMGLVGMHFVALTQSSPTWIWSTFEHIDNTMADDLAFGTSKAGKKVRVKAAFNNAQQPTKPVNQLAPPNAIPKRNYATGEIEKDAQGNIIYTGWDESKTTNPTQLTRLIPIPRSTDNLNKELQALFAEQGSVLQYYELDGTQWPVKPNYPAYPGGMTDRSQNIASSPESIHFKTPGFMVPVYLINTTMESFFQDGNQIAGPLEVDDRLPVGNWADNPREPVTPDRTIVYGNESCVGCHFSAGAVLDFKRDFNGNFVRDYQGNKIPIYGKDGLFGKNGNAHYFWQFQLKARQIKH